MTSSESPPAIVSVSCVTLINTELECEEERQIMSNKIFAQINISQNENILSLRLEWTDLNCVTLKSFLDKRIQSIIGFKSQYTGS